MPEPCAASSGRQLIFTFAIEMKTPLALVRLNIFADYHQFYLWDADLGIVHK